MEGLRECGMILMKNSNGRNQTILEKSGLNQQNAGGRDRHANEV